MCKGWFELRYHHKLCLSAPCEDCILRMADRAEAGGFLHSTLPSPPASTIASSSVAPSILPSPRDHPLKPGSSKESNFIEYVERKLLEISGRYERRFNVASREHPERWEHTVPSNGYENFGELAVDLENVIDVIWVSGTRMYPALVIVPCLRLRQLPCKPPIYSTSP